MKRIGYLAASLVAGGLMMGMLNGCNQAATAELVTKLSEAEQAKADAEAKVEELEARVEELEAERDDLATRLEKYTKRPVHRSTPKPTQVTKATPAPTPKSTATPRKKNLKQIKMENKWKGPGKGK